MLSPGRSGSRALAALSPGAGRPPLLAQYGRSISEREKAGYWRAGPFRLTPLVQLRNAGVDSNPFLTPGGRGVRRPRWSSGPDSRPTCRWDTACAFAATAGSTTPSSPTPSRPRAFDPGGDLRAELDVSRLTFYGGGGHFSARQRYTTDIDTRIQRTEDWLNGGLQLRVTTHHRRSTSGSRSAASATTPRTPADEQIKILLDRDSLLLPGPLPLRAHASHDRCS